MVVDVPFHMIKSLCITALSIAVALSSAAGDDIPLVSSKDLSGDGYVRKLVRFEGRVTDQFKDDANPDYCFLTLEDDFGSVYFSSRIASCPFLATNDYTGCRVSIVGNNMPAIAKTKGTRQYLFNELMYLEYGSFTVLAPPERDFFDVPELSPTASIPLGEFPSLGNRKLAGRVLAVREPDEILILTASNTVSRIATRGGPLPRPGDCIEAVGRVETDTYFLNLSRARWRKASPFPTADVPPRELAAPQMMATAANRTTINTKLHGQTIRIRAVVRSLPDSGFGRQIVFAESGGLTFPVDAGACPSAVENLERGATIDATGVCWIEIENWRPAALFPQAKGFSLVLRSPDDIVVISRPPWWTVARLTTVIGAMVILMLAVLIWNRALHLAARRQGEKLFLEQSARLSSELKTKERSRLAVELHDSISQVLTGAALKIKTAQATARTDLDRALANLSIAESSLRSSREELRYCLWDLRNNIFDLPDFEEAVRQMLRPYMGDAELAVRLPVPRKKISDSTAHEILKIIRELAVNAVRHGAATKVRVAGSLEGNTLSFSVKDNGSGYDEATAAGPEQGHFGLLGIRDRLAHCNGTLTIEGRRGVGTKATVSMQIALQQTVEDI